jgi:tricorn protease
MSRIDIVNLEDSSVEAMPSSGANDRNPMWMGNTIYFVSDRGGTFNLYSYDPQTRQVQQLTDYETFGITDASATGGVVTFVQDGRIRVWDAQSGGTTDIELHLEPDRSQLEPRTVAAGEFIQSASPSAFGDRVVFGARGDVLMLDLASGATQNLTGTPGAVEREPVMSPDGQWVAFLSDESGEYQLQVRSLADEGRTRRIPVELQSSFYRELVWSPDSKRLAFSDKRLRLWVVDVETGGARRVTTSNYSYQDRYYPSWSPDGIWLAYSRYEPNGLRAVYLYNAERGRQLNITHGRVNAEHPTFDADGRYLYFVASSTASLGEFGWGVLSGLLLRPYAARRLHVVSLRESVPPPVSAINGELLAGGDAPRQLIGPPPGDARGGRGGRGLPLAQTETVDLPGIENRVVPLPLAHRDYADLAAGEPGVLFVLVREWPPSPTFGSESAHTLYRFDLANPTELTKLATDVDDFSVTADGSKILVRQGDEWSLLASNGPVEGESGRIDTSALQVEVDPAAEWRQIYHEAFRLLKDYFYDPNYFGEDLRQLEEHYATYLPTVVRRQDLNLLLGKALGHISGSHLGVSGGDVAEPTAEPERIGLLGADYVVDGSYYRFARIYRSGHFNSETPLAQAPLDQPGIMVRPGEYLMSVNGQAVTSNRDVHSYFVGTAMRTTRIAVASDSTGAYVRAYNVVPLPDESTLRRWNWAESNRRVVEQESQGVLGYVFIPDFGPAGIVATFRQLLENTDRRGLVIDQRFAVGSITADYLIELLQRRPLFYYAFRQGDDLPVPSNPMPEARALLINDVNQSAAETFALMFRLGNLGRVMGTRTWGASIVPYVYIPPLIDGGTMTIPTLAEFDPAGSWAIENKGVEPDIEVEWPAFEWRQGRDTQLQAAIRAVLQLIVDRPPLEVRRPDFPVHGQPPEEPQQ